MATTVWIVACAQMPNVRATTLAQECPVGQRRTFQTTLEFFEQQTFTPSAEPELDTASVVGVFSLAFSVTVLFYLVARGAGSVLSLIRRG